MKNAKELSKLEIAAFCEQMAMIVDSGITPKDGLNLMLSDSKDSLTKAVLCSVLEQSEAGESFSDSLKNSGYFPDYVINMVALGEESGKLDDVLKALAKYYEHEEDVADNIRSAVTYPVIMILMMAVIVIILITKVLPMFNQVFVQLGTQMSGVAASLLSFGQSISKYSWAGISVLTAILILMLLLNKTDWGRKSKNHLLSIFPPTKAYQRDVAYGRFSRGLSLTLSSGMRIYQALDLVCDLVENKQVEAEIFSLKQYIIEGFNFAESLSKAGLFNHLYSQMVYVGVKSGNVDVILDKIATLYEEDTDKRLRNFIAILEPSLVIFLSLVVGLILLSVILPLLGVMSTMG